jgi:ATP-dependent Clp protease protease subunit
MRKRPWYRIQNATKSDEATVYIYDVIDSDPWVGGVSAKDLVKELAGIKASSIHVRLNSPGGDFFDGMAIYNALKRHPAEIVAHVDGLAASAASLIALAGDRVLMGTGSFMMIHNAWGIAIGDAATMREMADTLEKISDSIAGVYVERTGKSPAEIRELLDAETWLSAEEAVKEGFADATEESDKKVSASFDLSRFKNTPRQLQESAEKAPRFETIREFEDFLRDEGGLSNAAAKAIAASGFKNAESEPRAEDESGVIDGILAQLVHTQLAASLTR